MKLKILSYSWDTDWQKFQHSGVELEEIIFQDKDFWCVFELLLKDRIEVGHGLLGDALRYWWLLISFVPKKVLKATRLLLNHKSLCLYTTQCLQLEWYWKSKQRWKLVWAHNFEQQGAFEKLPGMGPCVSCLNIHSVDNQISVENAQRCPHCI